MKNTFLYVSIEVKLLWKGLESHKQKSKRREADGFGTIYSALSMTANPPVETFWFSARSTVNNTLKLVHTCLSTSLSLYIYIYTHIYIYIHIPLALPGTDIYIYILSTPELQTKKRKKHYEEGEESQDIYIYTTKKKNSKKSTDLRFWQLVRFRGIIRTRRSLNNM